MADNLLYTEPGAGEPIATDDVGGVHYQIVKQSFGEADTATLVTDSVGLPSNLIQIDNQPIISGGENGLLAVGGNVAHAATNTGNPVLFGGVNVNDPVSVGDGERSNVLVDPLGRLVVVVDAPRARTIENTITLSDTTETTIITAGASGVFHDLTLLILTNTSATATRVDVRDATAGSVKFSIFLGANAGAILQPPRPITQFADESNWTIQLGTGVTDVRCFAQVVRV